MFDLQERADGIVLAVHAQPGARRQGIVGLHGQALKIAVTAPADQGKANAAIVEVLAQALGVKKAQVDLVAGLSSRAKKIRVGGLTAAEIREKLGQWLGT